MNEINKTLFIPLYGKALVSQMGIILEDKIAESIWAAEGFPLRGFDKAFFRRMFTGKTYQKIYRLYELNTK